MNKGEKWEYAHCILQTEWKPSQLKHRVPGGRTGGGDGAGKVSPFLCPWAVGTHW